MAKLYFNTRDELNCIETDMIAVVQANGNYSRVVYITKKEVTLTTGISKLEVTLKSYNDKNRFIRLGRSFIINHSYLTKVDVLKQVLVLSDNDKNEIRVTIPKNILKSYKNAISKSIKIKEKKEDGNNHIG
ncbi:MAG: LytTR family transcriptional regulator DNA-binding domain-containing protein [Prevotella sp.]|nr:LytTR family transcriptional regulator DNA-binding domain-containing protein [Prevotella sp.]